MLLDVFRIEFILKNDGYQNAVKNVLDNKEKFSGIIGTVADIISTDKKFGLNNGTNKNLDMLSLFKNLLFL